MRVNFKKGMCFALSSAMLMTMPVVPGIVNEVKAENAALQVKDINLGTYGWDNPGQPKSADDVWAGGVAHYVYFGEYAQSDKTGATKEPIRWRVLDNTNDSNADGIDDSVFLLSDSVLDIQQFNYSRADGDAWATSDLRAWLNSIDGWSGKGTAGGFLNLAFNDADKNAIANTVVNETDATASPYNFCNPCSLTGEKVFVLSLNEAQNLEYGFFANKLGVNNNTTYIKNSSYAWAKDHSGNMGLYWLRSAVGQYNDNHNLVAFIDTKGWYNNYYVDYNYIGVAPAINLDMESVAFTTAAGFKKGDFAIVGNSNADDEWNVTVFDGDGFEANGSFGRNACTGDRVKINITNVPSLTSGNVYTQISAMLMDENNSLIAYGKISDSVAVGEVEFVLPVDLNAGNYTLKVFAEDVNSTSTENATDYISNMVGIDLYVKRVDIAALEAFVERMYTVALNREADVTGKNNWVTMLKTGTHDGAGIVEEFILGEEFALRQLSDEEFLDVLYHTLFDREPDAAGKELWLAVLAAGQTRGYVLFNFVNLNEFTLLCNRYGIQRGIMFENGQACNAGLVQFVNRLYTLVMGRDADQEGLYLWTLSLTVGTENAQSVARSFFNGVEYSMKNTDNETYVRDLYNVFMNRPADEEGLALWVSCIEQFVMTRDEVLSEFAASEEFAQIKAGYGLQ